MTSITSKVTTVDTSFKVGEGVLGVGAMVGDSVGGIVGDGVGPQEG